MPRTRPSLVLLPLVLAVALLGLSACAAGREHRPPEAERGEAIYVASNGWHTGVVVEGSRIPPARWSRRDALGGRRYVEVGWGDRDAYVADRLTTRLALRAAFASRGSVLLVAGFDEPVPERFRGIDVVEIRVSAGALEGLSAFIEASHVPDAAGETVPLAPGWGPSWAFYTARGRFHILNTCNTWTARALRAAGLPVRPALTLTAYHVMQQVRPLGRLVLTGPA